MALDPLMVPPGFLDVASVEREGCGKHVNLNVIGVVVDFLPPAPTSGTDYTIKFTLRDSLFTTGVGLTVRFFRKLEAELPMIQNNGDVLILRNMQLVNHRGLATLLSNYSSSWVVLEHASLQESKDPNGSDVIFHQSKIKSQLAARPTATELRYAKAQLALEDPSRWQQPAKSTSLQIAAIQRANGGTPAPQPGIFRTIADLQVPQHQNDKTYVDMFVEVRRMYVSSNDSLARVELSVTDWTEHPFLYNYTPQSEDTNDGDQYGYIKGTNKLWPAPWGKMTMLAILWPPHREYAVSNVQAGDFVYLRRVKIKLDSDGTKLEGVLHGDRVHENRINISVYKLKDAENDEIFKALLQRKRAHEEYCKMNGLRFIRDLKRESSDSKRKQLPQQEEDIATALTTKQKRNRENKRRKRAKGGASATSNPNQPDSGAEGEASVPSNNAPSTNTYVRTNNTPIPLTSITNILSPDTLLRTTPAGNAFHLPFQNCVYKSKVRVIDFYPPNLADFAVPVHESQYAGLNGDDVSGGDDSESDVAMADVDDNSPSSSGPDGDRRWQWRFMLLIEDPSPSHRKSNTNTNPDDDGDDDNTPRHLELLVSDSDADYLLRDIDACNLRTHPKALARLREKLFVLWGDLEERKREASDESRNVDSQTRAENGQPQPNPAGGAVLRVKPTARPFECFIKEYGVRVPRVQTRVVGNNGPGQQLYQQQQQQQQQQQVEWERMWRLCYTCIR